MHGSIQLFYRLVGFTFVPSWGSCTSKAPQENTSAVTYKFSTTSAITNQDSIKEKTIDIENEKNKNIDPYTDILIDGKNNKKRVG
jgi:hypothetical protein